LSTAIRLLHGDFGRVALLRMTAPLVVHAHHHCHVLIKAAGSDAAFNVSGMRVPLTSENAVLVNAWEQHAFISEAGLGDDPTVILALYIEPSWLQQHCPSIRERVYSKFFGRSYACLQPHQIKMIESIVMELWWSDTVARESIETMLADLSISFLRESGGPYRTYSQHYSQGKNFMDPRIRAAITQMKENPEIAADMAALAMRVQLSRSHFFELFRRCTGLSPVLYANALKMEQAFKALAATDRSMEQISQELGFSAQSHFSRFFRQHQGVVPSHYRRNLESIDLKKSDRQVNFQAL
jgi:AraC-like DNA-binding protein